MRLLEFSKDPQCQSSISWDFQIKNCFIFMIAVDRHNLSVSISVSLFIVVITSARRFTYYLILLGLAEV